MWKYGQFSGVRNYFVMAGPRGSEAEEKTGYYGEKLVLLAQTLGLNTCWVGLTYKKIPGTFTLRDGDMVHCVIAVGYGLTEGVQHPLKPASHYFEPYGPKPEWFMAGISAAMLAPTAVNQQKFSFEYIGMENNRHKIRARKGFSMIGYTQMDLGIAKYHFEIGAGKENFIWV